MPPSVIPEDSSGALGRGEGGGEGDGGGIEGASSTTTSFLQSSRVRPAMLRWSSMLEPFVSPLRVGGGGSGSRNAAGSESSRHGTEAQSRLSLDAEAGISGGAGQERRALQSGEEQGSIESSSETARALDELSGVAEPPSSQSPSSVEADLSNIVDWLEKNLPYVLLLVALFLYHRMLDIAILYLFHRSWKRIHAMLGQVFSKWMQALSVESLSSTCDAVMRGRLRDGSFTAFGGLHDVAGSVKSCALVAFWGPSLSLLIALLEPTLFEHWMFRIPSAAWRTSLWSVVYVVLLSDTLLRFLAASCKALIFYISFLRPASLASISPRSGRDHLVFLFRMHRRIRLTGMAMSLCDQIFAIFRIVICALPWLSFYLFSSQSAVFAAAISALYSIMKVQHIISQSAVLWSQIAMVWQYCRQPQSICHASALDGTACAVDEETGNDNSQSLFSDLISTLPLPIQGARFLSDTERARLSRPSVTVVADGTLPSDISSPQCAICHDDLGAQAVILECGHMFDLQCLEEWVRRAPTCPLCRRSVSMACSPTVEVHSDVGVLIL